MQTPALDPDPCWEAAYYDALRLSPTSLARLLEALDARVIGSPVAERRRALRVAFRPAERARILVHHLDGSRGRFRIAMRNLARRGAGFLHGGFLHPGSRVALIVPDLEGRFVTLEGTTVRCRLIGAHIHECGVAFDQAVDLERFLADPPEEALLPGGGRRLLGGRVLILDGAAGAAVRAFRDAVPNAYTVFETARGARRARSRLAAETFDLVVADPNRLPGEVGAAVAWLRSHAGEAQLALLLAEVDYPAELAALGAGCAAVLHRPVTAEGASELLRAALPEHPDADDAPPMNCTMWGHVAMRPVITKFARRAAERGDRLAGSLRDGACRDALTLCRDLRADAASHGFPELAHAAAQLFDAISSHLGDPPGDRAPLLRAARKLARKCAAARRFVDGAA